jgi:hypothetical protein
MNTNIHSWSYVSQILLRMKSASDKLCRQIKTHILCSIIFFFVNHAFYEIIWLYSRGGRPQKTIWRMGFACWIPVATKYTVNLCNVYCFCTETVVEWTLLNITLYLYWLSCVEWRCEQLRMRRMSGDEWVMSKQLSWSFLSWILTFSHLMTCIYVVPHRKPPDAAFYIFIQQIYVLNILNMLQTLRFFLFKMPFIS